MGTASSFVAILFILLCQILTDQINFQNLNTRFIHTSLSDYKTRIPHFYRSRVRDVTVCLNESISRTSLNVRPAFSVFKLKNQKPQFTTKNYSHFRAVVLYQLSLALLLVAHDIESNPGPPKYPCQVCSKAVLWSHKAVACDNCQQWIHTRCMGMSTQIYNTIGHDDTWICCQCSLPNLSSGMFTSTSMGSSTLDSSTGSDIDIGVPLQTSSPNKNSQHKIVNILNHKVKVLVINFQSLKSKKELLLNLIDSSDPDVIIGTKYLQ